MEPNGPALRTTAAELAEIGYNAYVDVVGGVAFNGDTLPPFSDVPDRIEEAWIAAADSIRIAVVTGR